jgi:hypothetical protein
MVDQSQRRQPEELHPVGLDRWARPLHPRGWDVKDRLRNRQSLRIPAAGKVGPPSGRSLPFHQIGLGRLARRPHPNIAHGLPLHRARAARTSCTGALTSCTGCPYIVHRSPCIAHRRPCIAQESPNLVHEDSFHAFRDFLHAPTGCRAATRDFFAARMDFLDAAMTFRAA